MPARNFIQSVANVQALYGAGRAFDFLAFPTFIIVRADALSKVGFSFVGLTGRV